MAPNARWGGSNLSHVKSGGFRDIPRASKRPCCRPKYPCTGRGVGVEVDANFGRHVFSSCSTSTYTKCVQIQLEPLASEAHHRYAGFLFWKASALVMPRRGASSLQWGLKVQGRTSGSFRQERAHVLPRRATRVPLYSLTGVFVLSSRAVYSQFACAVYVRL